MKLIKVVSFIVQFGLIGLGLAALFLVWQSDFRGNDLARVLSGAAFSDTGQNPSQGRNGHITSYADAVSSSFSSVVTVYTTKQVAQKSHPLLTDPVFNQLFSDQLERREENRTETNLGSGVIISSDGYIITNQHVIDGADEILVSLADGRGSEATLIGEDQETDLAVLLIPINGLDEIEIASNQPVRVGDVVLAIGNPLNVGQTVTMGIVSATGRNRIGMSPFENFIQTDAAINPGNSGGALINAEGRLIGINTAIFSQTGGYQGIGFAIPISIALDIKQQLIDSGKVTRGWIGVVGDRQISAEAAMATGDPNIRGALIVGVLIDSPADIAGIRPGDIIIEINRSAVTNIRDLLEVITLHQPGELIEATVYRGPEKINFTMRAIERPQ